MKRRELLKAGVLGTAGLVSGGIGLLSWAPRSGATHIPVNLDIVSAAVPMADGQLIYAFSYSGVGAHGAQPMSFPGPTIVCQEGDTVQVTLNNTLGTDCSFAIGRTGLRWDVAAGASQSFSFTAPAPGTYLYHDDLNNGVNRVMGLHGALVVMPAGVAIQSFAGAPTFVRQYKWLLGNFDPVWAAAVQANGDNYVTTLAGQWQSFTPKYFTINGNSFDQTHNPDTEIMGAVGNAALVRMLNAGMAVHSLHFHSNHVKVCSINGENFATNQKKKDAISMFPLDTRDAIFPFEAPPDIPAGEFALGLDLSTSPQHYPMHCHTELSQTAGGGFYPHGMHTGIVIGQDPVEESDVTLGADAL